MDPELLSAYEHYTMVLCHATGYSYIVIYILTRLPYSLNVAEASVLRAGLEGNMRSVLTCSSPHEDTLNENSSNCCLVASARRCLEATPFS